MFQSFIPTDAPEEFGDDPARPRGPTGTPPDASTLGVKILLGSLAMLFGATLIGYVWTRWGKEDWDGYKIEGFEFGLGLSTAAIVLVSLFMHLGLVSIQKGKYQALTRYMILAGLAAAAFLVCQIINWRHLIGFYGGIDKAQDLSAFLFYGMTFLHALHVVGGVIPLAIVIRNAAREHYAPARFRGVYDCALYWHFIDGVWVVMALAFLIG